MRPWALLLLACAAGCSNPSAPSPVTDIPTGADITFATEPPGATVILDGQKLDGVTPLTRHMDTGGRPHAVRFALAGHQASASQTFLVPIRAYTVRATLEPFPAMAITTDPAGAAVTLDGAPVMAHTPGSFELSPGAHELVISLAGRVPQRVHLADGAKGPLAIALPVAASIEVTSLPSEGAKIRVDGQDTGQVTPAVVPVAAGCAHVVVVELGALKSRPTRASKLRAGAQGHLALTLANQGRLELLRRKRALAHQAYQLRRRIKVLTRATAAFVIHDAKKEYAQEEALARANADLEATIEEQGEVDDALEAP